MLVNFSIKNFKSFREESALSMVVSSLKETFTIPSGAFIEADKNLRINPVSVLYGANASGKSNLIDAIAQMKYFTLTSLARENIKDKIPVEPFRLSTVTENQPTEFEISFIKSGKLYRYGFLASQDVIEEEWLFEKELKPRNKDKELFYREKNSLESHPSLFKVGSLIRTQNLAKENVLILSLAHQFNDENAKNVIDWFTNLNTLKGHEDGEYHNFSATQIKTQTHIANEMEKLIRFADTGIVGLSSATVFNEEEVLSSHLKFNENNEPVHEYKFTMSKQESEGTRKLFNLSGPIFNSLAEGKVLIVDELDSKLHPNLTEKLVLMFQDRNINTKGAQLIFATHNTNLLSAKLLRRDQVWITEKNEFGATQLYSIADYKTDKGKARNTEAIEQNYIEGKYGGTPFLGDLENFLEQYSHEQKTGTPK